MHLHLFSTPGENDLRYIAEASQPYLSGKSDATIAFLPQASLNVNHWLDYTVRAFDGLARVELIDTEQMELAEMESIIRRAQVVYIFFAHYAQDTYGQAAHDDWLLDYHLSRDNPVIMLSDGAYVKVEGKKTSVVRGEAWILRKDQEKEKLEEGKLVVR